MLSAIITWHMGAAVGVASKGGCETPGRKRDRSRSKSQPLRHSNCRIVTAKKRRLARSKGLRRLRRQQRVALQFSQQQHQSRQQPLNETSCQTQQHLWVTYRSDRPAWAFSQRGLNDHQGRMPSEKMGDAEPIRQPKETYCDDMHINCLIGHIDYVLSLRHMTKERCSRTDLQ
jgi:hypothetical protein